VEKTVAKPKNSIARTAEGLSAGFAIHPLYKIIKEISSDPLGVLYSAEYVPEHKKVALKVLQRGVACNAKPAASQSADTVKVINVIKGAHGESIIVLEHPLGEPLKKLMSRQGLMFVRPAVAIVRQILSALQHLHAEGCVVGALHPGSVFVSRTNDGKLKIKLAYFHQKACATFVNHDRYRPPELFDQGGVGDFSSDLWAAGAVLYEMLFGLIPFESSKSNEVDRVSADKQLFLSHRFEEDSPALSAVLRQALNLNPGRRYQTAESLRVALLNVEKNSNASPPPIISVPSSMHVSKPASNPRRESVPTVPSPPRNSLIVESSKPEYDFFNEVDEDDTRPIIPPEMLAEMLSKKGRLNGLFPIPKKRSYFFAAVVAAMVTLAFGWFQFRSKLTDFDNQDSRPKSLFNSGASLDAALPMNKPPGDPKNAGKAEEGGDISTPVETGSSSTGLPLTDGYNSQNKASHKHKKKSGKMGKAKPADDLSSNPFFLKNNPFPGGE
jgi:serine/threonine-protein kinase